MDINPFIDRLHDDESLTDNLTDEQATPLLAWGEGRLEKAATELEATQVLETIRDINRRVADGEAFEGLLPSDPAPAGDIPTPGTSTPAPDTH